MLRLLIILFFSSAAVKSSCPESDQIHCGTSARCTRLQYVCDGDNDCGDYSDEESELCDAWRNSDCSRGQVDCYRRGNSDCVSLQQYCILEDPPCDGDLDMRICQMLENEKLQPLDDIIIQSRRGGVAIQHETTNLELAELSGHDFDDMTPHTIKHDKCPLLYTRIGEECVSFFFFGTATWGESRAFCQSIGGDLYVPESSANYITLVHHLRDHHQTTNFWVGGNLHNETVGWRWVTGDQMDLGSPYWAIRHNVVCSHREINLQHRNATKEANEGFCYHYTQAPEVVPFGDCVAMTYDKFFYLSDEDCLIRASPLCKLAK